jgi:hypothetical protein
MTDNGWIAAKPEFNNHALCAPATPSKDCTFDVSRRDRQDLADAAAQQEENQKKQQEAFARLEAIKRPQATPWRQRRFVNMNGINFQLPADTCHEIRVKENQTGKPLEVWVFVDDRNFELHSIAKPAESYTVAGPQFRVEIWPPEGHRGEILVEEQTWRRTAAGCEILIQ